MLIVTRAHWMKNATCRGCERAVDEVEPFIVALVGVAAGFRIRLGVRVSIDIFDTTVVVAHGKTLWVRLGSVYQFQLSVRSFAIKCVHERCFRE